MDLELARCLAALVQSGRLSRSRADRLTRQVTAELERTDQLVTTLVSVLDPVVLAVERGQVQLHRYGAHDYFHLDSLLDEFPVRGALAALQFAVTSLPAAGVVSVGTRASFPGLARRRYVVIDFSQVKAFLARRRPVLPG